MLLWSDSIVCKVFGLTLTRPGSDEDWWLFPGFASAGGRTCGLIPLPGFAKLHTGSGMTKVDFYYAQMTSGVWGQWLSLCQVYRTAFRSRDIICDKIYGLKVGLHCFKELQFIGESETMQTNIVCWSAMAADKECVVVTTTAKSLIGQLAPGQHACLLLLLPATNRFY